jgi:diguanylate cyclase (GGDEF)-like protein/PAS domain S-box-containing protein
VEWLPSGDTALPEGDGTLDRVLCGRIAAVALVVCSVLLLGSDLVSPGILSVPALLISAGTSVALGAVAWWFPWDRFGRWAVLAVIPFAFVAVDLTWVYADRRPFSYSVTFVVIFALVGLALPRWTALRLAPFLAVAYLAPLAATPGPLSTLGLGSAVFVIPICVLLGEAIAWGMHRYALAELEIAESLASIQRLFDQAPIGISKLGLDGRFLEVNLAYAEIHGYRREAMEGMAVRDLVHPDDRAANQANITGLLSGEIDRFQTERRSVRSDGRVVWVSLNGSVVRDAGGEPLFMIGQIEDITERRALREQLALHAVTDPLTGLPNRKLFMEHLVRALHRAESDGRHVALMFLDLDRFKLVNDGIGHDAGDRLLQRVGQRLQNALRPGDFLARFGGDEFTVLCEVGGDDDVLDIVGRLRKSLATPVSEADFEQFVTISIGVALSTSETMLPSALLRSADIAMYQAKRLGPGRYVVHSPDGDDDAGWSLRTSNELHRAIQGSQLVLHYQPFVDVERLTVVGTEALVRWQHPTRGLLPPSEFIDLAEECGLMVDLGSWVLREACRQGATWLGARVAAGQLTGLPAMSVNISPQQLAEPGFCEFVVSVLEGTGFPPDRLWLEITEGALLRDPPAAIAILRSLRALGVHLAIDDFGTGYSSLSYLKRLPVEALKIDRSFVEHLETGSDDRAIVEAIVALGRTLGLQVVAEGIERPGQAIELVARGCHIAQGFLYGRPVAPGAIGPVLPDSVAGWETGSRLAPV